MIAATQETKASILAGVSGYLEQLQLHNATLESEQCEIVSRIVSIAAPLVEKVDYKRLFLQSATPMAVASVDGKLLTWNDRFATGLNDVLDRTIFDLAKPERLPHVFSCISDVLKSSDHAPHVDIPDALQHSNATLSITLLRPSSLAISLVDVLIAPPLTRRYPTGDPPPPTTDPPLVPVDDAHRIIG